MVFLLHHGQPSSASTASFLEVTTNTNASRRDVLDSEADVNPGLLLPIVKTEGKWWMC